MISSEQDHAELEKYLYGVIMVLIQLLIGGFVIMTLWGWFVVPTFELPELTYVGAMGLDLVISFFTYHYREAPSDEFLGDMLSRGKKLGTHIFIRPILYLMLGFIVHLFM